MKRYAKFMAAVLISAMVMSTGCANNVVSDKSGTLNSSGSGSSTGNTASTEFTKKSGDDVVLTRQEYYPAYDEEEIRKTVKSVQDKITGETVSYIFITDLHIDDSEEVTESGFNTLNALVDVANNTDVDFVCVGGDLYNGMNAEENGKAHALATIQSISDVLKNCNKPVFILHGNHDDNSFSAQKDWDLLYSSDYVINKDEWYSVTMANFSQYATDYQQGYFYYDIPGKNVRVICLNMSDSDDTVVDGKQNEIGMYFYGYKDEQIDWLLNKAMTRDNCQYYIMDHDAFDYPEGYEPFSNRETLRNILSAAYQKQAYNDGRFSKDFSAWNSQLVLMNSGHLHLERHIADEKTGGLVILNTDRCKLSRGYVWGNFSNEGYTVAAERTSGTVTEGLFNVVISSPDKIDIVRFGAGEDDTFNY